MSAISHEVSPWEILHDSDEIFCIDPILVGTLEILHDPSTVDFTPNLEKSINGIQINDP
jgi:hypothetical protein